MSEITHIHDPQSGAQGATLLLGRRLSSTAPASIVPDENLLRMIPEFLEIRYQAFPLALRENGVLVLGMVDPHNRVALDDLQQVTGFQIEPVQVPEDDFRAVAAYLRPDYKEAPSYVCVLDTMSISAQIVGPLANVKVRQVFHNPSEEMLEAVYFFPVPSQAVLSQFRLQVGERLIEGALEQNPQLLPTEGQYSNLQGMLSQLGGVEKPRRSFWDWFRGSKVTQGEASRVERPAARPQQPGHNVFTATLGNLSPGQTVTLELSYAHPLEMDESSTTFRFPLLVAPRYISQSPGVHQATPQVPDASKNSPPVLPPGLRAAGALSLEVEIEHGDLPLTELACTQPALRRQLDSTRTAIELARTGETLDQDFVLRFQLGKAASPRR